METCILETSQLSKKYKNTDYYAVNPIDFSINKQEILGFLGPNGAGKTTLISMLSGILKPTKGTVLIQGLDFRKHKKEIQKRIGIVPQEYALYPTLTAQENLNYFGAMYGLKSNVLKSKIEFYLTEMGLIDFKDKKIKTFSGGMKRRVNLIAGILHDPQLLYLDEPTVGVDVQSKQVIIEQLNKLNNSGTTIIYTSHHMVEAQDFCTKVIIIDRGTIIAKGTPKELIASVAGATTLEEVYLKHTGLKLRDHV